MANRKKKPSKSSARTKHAPDAPPPFRTFEKAFAGFADGLPSDDPLDRAQDLIYQAWEIPNPAKRIALAKQALALCADCTDAYLLLAEEQAHTLEQALDLFEQAVAAGERALGPQTFKNDVGHFWSLFETRPYMRARQQLALALWEFGDRSDAIDHAQGLLRLNPNDNQGMRYALIDWLLQTGNLLSAHELWTQYEDDASAGWAWSRALMDFMEHGDTDAPHAHAKAAVACNPHVPSLLLGRQALPEDEPEYIGIGDMSEAVAYALSARGLWQQTNGALRWLSNMVPDKRS